MADTNCDTVDDRNGQIPSKSIVDLRSSLIVPTRPTSGVRGSPYSPLIYGVANRESTTAFAPKSISEEDLQNVPSTTLAACQRFLEGVRESQHSMGCSISSNFSDLQQRIERALQAKNRSKRSRGYFLPGNLHIADGQVMELDDPESEPHSQTHRSTQIESSPSGLSDNPKMGSKSQSVNKHVSNEAKRLGYWRTSVLNEDSPATGHEPSNADQPPPTYLELQLERTIEPANSSFFKPGAEYVPAKGDVLPSDEFLAIIPCGESPAALLVRKDLKESYEHLHNWLDMTGWYHERYRERRLSQAGYLADFLDIEAEAAKGSHAQPKDTPRQRSAAMMDVSMGDSSAQPLNVQRIVAERGKGPRTQSGALEERCSSVSDHPWNHLTSQGERLPETRVDSVGHRRRDSLVPPLAENPNSHVGRPVHVTTRVNYKMDDSPANRGLSSLKTKEDRATHAMSSNRRAKSPERHRRRMDRSYATRDRRSRSPAIRYDREDRNMYDRGDKRRASSERRRGYYFDSYGSRAYAPFDGPYGGLHRRSYGDKYPDKTTYARGYRH